MRGALIATILLVTTAAEAQQGAWRHQSNLQARSNRPGFGLLSFTGYRQRLFDDDAGLLLRGAYLEAGAVTQLSPASFHPGLYVETVPVAPILLRASVTRLMYFGTFGPISTTPTPHSEWDEDFLHDIQEDGGRPGGGFLAEGLARLRLKLGPVVALWENRLSYVTADVPEGAGWYEPITDLLMAQEERLHTMKTTAGYIVWGSIPGERSLVVGGHWERYTTLESAVRRDIVGLVALWKATDWGGAPVTFIALAGAMADDVYRTGEPYIGAVMRVDVGGPAP